MISEILRLEIFFFKNKRQTHVGTFEKCPKNKAQDPNKNSEWAPGPSKILQTKADEATVSPNQIQQDLSSGRTRIIS